MNDKATPSGTFIIPDINTRNAVRLDGRGSDRTWTRALTFTDMTMKKGYKGTPFMPSSVSIVQAGQWLIFACEAEEKSGVIARESVPGIAMWFDDAFILEIKGDEKLFIMVNPLGAVYAQFNGKTKTSLISKGRIQCAARIEGGKWRIETAIDIREIASGPDIPLSLEVSITRQRQARGCTEPFEESVIPAPGKKLMLSLENGWRKGNTVPLDIALPQRFAGRTLLDAGFSGTVPADESVWNTIPVMLLSPENGRIPLDPSFEPTEVRAAVTEKEIAFRITCHESHSDTIHDPGEAIWSEDNIELFIGPERYRYLQLLLSPSGRIEASRGNPGGRRVRGIKVPRGVVYKAQKKEKCWTVDVTIPLAEITSVAEAPDELHPRVYPWVVQITRNRPARNALGHPQQYSLLSVMNSSTSHCPLRYAGLRVKGVTGTEIAAPKWSKPELPLPVLSQKERETLKASTLLKQWINIRKKAVDEKHKKRFDKITSADEWKEYAGSIHSGMMKYLFPARKGVLPERTPLQAQIVYNHDCDGFKNLGLILLSQSGLPVAATLFIPENVKKDTKCPALVIIPAHHTQRNSRDVLIVGANFARNGGIALATESIGSGERLVTAAFRHKRQQRNLTGSQILLAGETLEGWTAWDVSRCVDYLIARGDVDPKRIGVLGGVAGGGDLSSLAAFLDPRISLSIPFNFWQDRPFGGYYDSLRAYFGANAAGCTPWMTNAVIAPRRLIQAMEFAWSDQLQSLQDKYKKVFGFFGKEDNVTFLHGGPNTHATHFNTMHRHPMYKIINKWFGMSIMKNGKEYTGHQRASDLECYQSPGGHYLMSTWRSEGKAFKPHEVALGYTRDRLAKARAGYAGDSERLKKELDTVLGNTAPVQIDMKNL
ncbi:hypothetical protein ACFL6F_03770, partial [Planctomycetota bacterium]